MPQSRCVHVIAMHLYLVGALMYPVNESEADFAVFRVYENHISFTFLGHV